MSDKDETGNTLGPTPSDYRSKVPARNNDLPGNIVVWGFIAAIVAGLASGLPGFGWLVWIAILGILPFVVTAIGALFNSLHDLLKR